MDLLLDKGNVLDNLDKVLLVMPNKEILVDKEDLVEWLDLIIF